MKKQKSVSIESVIARIDAALESNTDATEPTPLATAPGPLAKTNPHQTRPTRNSVPNPMNGKSAHTAVSLTPFSRRPTPTQ